MNRNLFRSLLIALFVLVAAAAQAGPGQKVTVCHIPPGDPGNFHTITIGGNALQAHLAHGDLAGSCALYCDTLCSDGDPCTVDACDASEQCLVEHPPVDCNDGSLCTVDTCDSAVGCVSAPVACSDGDNCTLDACDPLTGLCLTPPVQCSAGETCDPATGQCVGSVSCPCVDPAFPVFWLVVAGEVPVIGCYTEPYGGMFEDGIVVAVDYFSVGAGLLTNGQWICGDETTLLPISPEQGQVCLDLLEQVVASQSVTCSSDDPGGPEG